MTARDWLQGHPCLDRWGLVLAWMALIFFLSAQPDLPHPESEWLASLVSGGAHLFFYAVLALLLNRALGNGVGGLVLAFGLALLYGVSDEFHQSLVPGRVPDALDLVSDGLGAALALAGWGLCKMLGRR